MIDIIEYLVIVTALSGFATWCFYEMKNAPDAGDGEYNKLALDKSVRGDIIRMSLRLTASNIIEGWRSLNKKKERRLIT